MSWDFDLRADLGNGEVSVCVDTCINHTSNTNGMIHIITGTSPSGWDGMRASEFLPLVETMIRSLTDSPEVFEPMNPANGWGSRTSLIHVLKKVKKECVRAPNAIVRMCC